MSEPTTTTNPTGRPPLTEAQRVLSRARTLMATKGYGWSKAIDVAAETLKKSE